MPRPSRIAALPGSGEQPPRSPAVAVASRGRVEVAPPAVRVGLLGLGTVGSGVVSVLSRNRGDIEQKVGRAIELVRILVRDPSKPRAAAVPAELITTDAEQVVGDPEIGVVVEAMGGTTDALAHMLRALRAGKSVVTANKDVMAEHGRQVWAAAAAGGADVYFEAAVGGGIPIVRALQQSLAGNSVRRIAGILNGTTNYILTRMTQAGSSLEQALAEAQAEGYAEADPSADVDGLDAARKLCILSSIAYSAYLRPSDVHVEGIRGLGAADIAYGQRMGWTIKLLGISELRQDRVSMRVHPTFIRRSHPLAAVHDTFNAIFVQGDAVGEAMFYGRGAGSLPTASAVLGDLMEAVRLHGSGVRASPKPYFRRRGALRIGSVVSRFYVRLLVPDRAGVLAKIAGVFARTEVSILEVLQLPATGDQARMARNPAEKLAELVIVTHEAREDQVQRTVAGLGRLESVAGVASVIRLAPGDL